MRKLLFTAAALAVAAAATASSAQAPRPTQTPVPAFTVNGKDQAYFAGRSGRVDPDSDWLAPFKIAGDVYYVGATNISSILIATPKGHVLIDTGTTKMGSVVVPNVARLGFKPSDIKYLLLSHAHMDHVQSLELHHRVLGATLMALDVEAPALMAGHDLSSFESEGWEPVKIDHILHDGEEFTVGGDKIKIIWTPGHTPGNAGYLITTQENGKPYTVFFGGMPTPVTGNPKYNTRPEDALHAFASLRALNPDAMLGGHMESFPGKLAGLQSGARPSPLALAPGAWAKIVDDAEAKYRQQLAASMAPPAAAR